MVARMLQFASSMSSDPMRNRNPVTVNSPIMIPSVAMRMTRYHSRSAKVSTVERRLVHSRCAL